MTLSFRRGLRAQVVWAFLAVAVVTVLVLMVLNRQLVGTWFDEAERTEAQRAQERIALLENERRLALTRTVHDYGHWQEMVNFLTAPTNEWLADNFSAGTLTNLDIDAVVIWDAQGETLAAFMLPEATTLLGVTDATLQADGLPAVPQDHTSALQALPAVQRMHHLHGSSTALLNFAGEWWQVGMSTIQPPDTTDTATGPKPVLAFLRALNAQRMAARFRQAQISYRYEALPARGDVPLAVVDEGDGHRLSVRLTDPLLGPQATAVAYRPPSLSDKTTQVRRLLMVESLTVILAALALAVLLVELRVLRPIARLGREIVAVRAGQREGVSFKRDGDEIDRLAQSFDDVLTTLHHHSVSWRHAALHDSLTGLWNRGGLLRLLDDATTVEHPHSAPFALFLIDLDGFKNVNDLYGHATGDKLLCAVADGLRSRLPSEWAIARLGGDEFAVLTQSNEPAQVDDLTLLAAVDDSVIDGPWRARITASVGRVDHNPRATSLKPGELLSRADIAMYRAKRHRGSLVVSYDDSMFHDLQERIGLETALAEAIAQHRIHVWFQPIVDARTGAVTRLEALARWNDPVRGPIPPSRFIAVAEETQQTFALDLHVLRIALAELRRLRRQVPDIKLSFNASVYSLLDRRYVDEVLALTKHYEVPCDALLLEITETALTDNEQALIPAILRLRQHGIGIALDDFGIGYSSLARLAQLKPDALKLDGSFVRSLDDGGDRIARAVVDMAEEFEIPVTAEFVETDAQRHFLEGIRCASLQGYLIAAPMPADRLGPWLAEHRGFSEVDRAEPPTAGATPPSSPPSG